MNKSLWVLIVIAILIAAIIICGAYVYLKNRATIASISNFDACKNAGYPIEESYPAVCKTPDGRTFTENIGNAIEKQDLIRVQTPRPGNAIVSPLTITGEARGMWYFEASFPVRIVTDDGDTVVSGAAQAQSNWMTENFVPFKITLEFQKPNATKGKIILMKDNPSGDPARDDQLEIPIVFGTPAVETMKVKTFFGNSLKNPNAQDCAAVYPIAREIPKTQAVARAALEELLKGPTDTEKSQGYITSINSGVKIQSLSIQGKTALVDFDSRLEEAVGGSCRVVNIRAQITNTLEQFATINNVIISINGRTEDILQP